MHRAACWNGALTGRRNALVQGRNVFQRDMEPFLKWLDEAEEEEED